MNRFITTLGIALLASALSGPISARIQPERAASTEQRLLPIVLTLFLHDQLTAAQIAELDSGYITWFANDLELITGRKVEVVKTRNAPGYTDFDYRLGDADKSLYEWDQRVIDFTVHNALPRSKRHKYVLVTPDDLTLLVQGIAGLGKRSAIASLTAYRNIAHEVGHTLGASHTDGQFHATAAPAPCITNMFVEDFFFLKNCWRYSEEAAQVIRDYLKDTP
jgi:hypothetical protein